MTAEVSAAVEGVLETAHAEVVVADSHGNARNLWIEKLHPKTRLIGGWPRRYGMVDGVEAGFDMLFLLGYHARYGSLRGGMDHSFSSAAVYNIRMDGRPVGEAELNAALAGHFGVPVGLVSGDDVLAENLADRFDPAVERVVVKSGISRHASNNLHPEAAREKIRSAAGRAVGRKIPPFTFPKGVVAEVDFITTGQADTVEGFPGTERIDGRTLRFAPAEDYAALYRSFMLVFRLAYAAAR
jgi:D-amino peptidase